MKKCLSIIAIALLSVSAIAQDVDYPNKGYRGFADLGMGFGSDEADWSYFSFAVNTVHGVQILPQLFLGGGLGVHSYGTLDTGDYDGDDYNDVFTVTPLFFDARCDFIPKRISPFVDMRLGYGLGDLEGLYLAPSAGVRLNHFNLSLSYVMQGYEYATGIGYKSSTKTGYLNSVLFRLTFDWGARK